MHFSVEHELPGSAGAIAAVLCDPNFHTGLDLPDVSRPEVLEHVQTPTGCRLRLRYLFVGHIDAWAKKLLGNRELKWIQEFEVDTTTGQGTLRFSAEADPNRLQGEADIDCAPAGDVTKQTIAGELRVKVPLIGGRAERALVPGIVRRLDVMTDALTTSLKDRE